MDLQLVSLRQIRLGDRLIKLSLLTIFLGACSSQSVLPDASEVTVSRKAPGRECRELGKVSGSTLTAKGTPEEALAEMKQEAVNKAANYIVVEQYGGTGTTVTGRAYQCP